MSQGSWMESFYYEENSSNTYEDSNALVSQMQSDIQSLVRQNWYYSIFETDGKLDMSKTVIRIKDSSGKEINYTLKDIVALEVGGVFQPTALFSGFRENYEYEDWSWHDASTERIIEYVVEGNSTNVVQDEEATAEYPLEENSNAEIMCDVIWFACDNRFPVLDPGSATINGLNSSYSEIGWKTASALNDYIYNLEKFDEKESNLYYRIIGNHSSENTDKSTEELKALGKYYIVECLDYGYDIDSNLNESEYNQYFLQTNNYNVLNKPGEKLVVALDTSFPVQDHYFANKTHWDNSYIYRTVIKILIPICGVLLLVTLLYLCKAAGKSKKTKKITTCFLDKIPLEPLLLGLAVLTFIFFKVISVIFRYSNEYYYYYNHQYIGQVLFYAISYLLFLVFLFSIIRRVRSNQLHSLILTGLVGIYHTGREHLKLSVQVGSISALTVILLVIASVLAGSSMNYWDRLTSSQKFMVIIGTLFAFLLCIGSITILVWKALQKEELQKGVTRVASGDLSYNIPLEKLTGADKKLANDINHISDGLQEAVETAMKNERLKTELISNVSHDIKTPLTSIINYVDLLKKGTEDQAVSAKYLDILEQKAHRLKVLTEDLVEASKASSGAIVLDVERIDFVQLVSQVNGEFVEKFDQKQLTIMVDLPEEPVFIMADGRRIWRVLENLYHNAVKYAMANTRVYINVMLEEGNQIVVFIIKNISADPLNISADDLTERFVRGDLSRTTEGSGLGLSIAKSLTELNHGSFEVYMDGDLFRVTLKFKVTIA